LLKPKPKNEIRSWCLRPRSVPPDRSGTRPNPDRLEWPISIPDFIGLAVPLGLVRNRNGPGSDSPLLFDAQNGSPPPEVRIENPLEEKLSRWWRTRQRKGGERWLRGGVK
jgi:hypothetical protein